MQAEPASEKHSQFYLTGSLFFNILLDCKFTEPNGRNIVTSSPERPRWEFFGFLLDPTGRFTLENLNGIGYGKLRRNGKIKMNMLIANVPTEKQKLLLVADELENPFQFLFNILVCHDFAAILCSPNNMVLANVCAVVQLIQSSIG